jgi:hypothetical protein
MKMINGKRGAKNRRNNSNRRGRQPLEQMGQMVISHPPSIGSYEITHGTRLRFLATAGVNLGITYQNLLDTIVAAATATSLFDVFTQVKIRGVEVWSSLVNVGSGLPVTVSVVFNGVTVGAAGDQIIHTDTSMGVQPAHVLARPNRKSQASQYQSSSSDEAFLLVAPAGSVIDVELSLRNVFGFGVAAQLPGVAATPGAVYLRGLDGVARSATSLPPVLPSSDTI